MTEDRKYAILFAATLLCAWKLPSPAYPISTFPDSRLPSMGRISTLGASWEE
jgi:hypothetical protein